MVKEFHLDRTTQMPKRMIDKLEPNKFTLLVQFLLLVKKVNSKEMNDLLKKLRIRLSFVMGKDGTMKGFNEVYKFLKIKLIHSIVLIHHLILYSYIGNI